MRLYKANVQHVAIVDKPASGIAWYRISKSADGSYSFTAYTPFEKAESDGDSVKISGVAYGINPGHPDLQGDWANAADVRQMKKTHDGNGRKLNLMHRADLTPEQAEVTKSKISPAGHWMLGATVKDKSIADGIRKGAFTGWSIGGSCQAGKAEDEDEQPSGRTEHYESVQEIEELTMSKSQQQELGEVREMTKQAHDFIQMLKGLDGSPAPKKEDQALKDFIERVEAFQESGQLEQVEKAVQDSTFGDTMKKLLGDASAALQAQRLPNVKAALDSALRQLDVWSKHREADQDPKDSPVSGPG